MTEAQILWIGIGGLAGWLAGLVLKGSGYGRAGDIIIGIVGGFIGGWLAEVLGLEVGNDMVPSLITAVFGTTAHGETNHRGRGEYTRRATRPAAARRSTLAERARNPAISGPSGVGAPAVLHAVDPAGSPSHQVRGPAVALTAPCRAARPRA